jgi:SPP1 family predicted phage head-tail adaptor
MSTLSPAVGTLDRRVIFESFAEEQASNGALTKAWATFATLWASIQPANGTERWQTDQVSAEVTHRILVHYTLGITPAMRITLGTRKFDILSVVNRDEADRTTEIMAKEHI